MEKEFQSGANQYSSKQSPYTSISSKSKEANALIHCLEVVSQLHEISSHGGSQAMRKEKKEESSRLPHQQAEALSPLPLIALCRTSAEQSKAAQQQHKTELYSSQIHLLMNTSVSSILKGVFLILSKENSTFKVEASCNLDGRKYAKHSSDTCYYYQSYQFTFIKYLL